MSAPPKPGPTLDVQSLSASCNQLLILSGLSSGAHHGYQLALELDERSDGAFRFQHGTLYPILHKLERMGLIRGDWVVEPSQRRRKSYRLTAAGRSHLAEQAAAWRSFFERLFHVVEESGK